MKTIILLFSIYFLSAINYAQKQSPFSELVLNPKGKGQKIKISVEKGEKYQFPIIAIWLTTLDGKYVQSLYVSKSIAKGIYEHGKTEEGKWFPGERRRPSAIPFWAYSRGIIEHDGLYIPTSKTPLADVYTGATPYKNFIITTNADQILKGKYKLLFEINQPFDFNDYWFNHLYPEDSPYRTSGQPSVVYCVEIDFDNPEAEYYLNPIGHGHPSGENGKIFTNLNTLTSALKIVKTIKAEILP